MANVKYINRKTVNRRNTGLIWLMLIVLIFVELFIYTLIRTESTNTALRISRAKAELANEKSYKQALLIEKEWLKSNAQLTEIAKKYFKLSPVTPERVIYIETIE